MTFKVNNLVSCAIFLNGKELVLDHGNFMKVLHIRAGALDPLPVMYLEFVDLLYQVPELGLTDGSTIEVHLTSTFKIVRKFRVFTWERRPIGDGYSYIINAYWDAPMFYMGTTCRGIEGTSYSALADIAQTCGLGFSVRNQSTSDSMLWMANNLMYSLWARDIARHGYREGKSHMVLAVDSHGTLRYWDINSNPRPAITVGFTPPSDNSQYITINDFTPIAASGTNNMIGGYMHTRHPQSAIEEPTPISKLYLDSDSNITAVNSGVRSEIERSYITHSPINFGNVHAEYEQAKVQNIRYNLLNSVQGEFLFGMMTNLEAMDNFTYAAPSDLNNNQYDGEYTIVTKIIFIAGADYNEKIIAARNGTNS